MPIEGINSICGANTDRVSFVLFHAFLVETLHLVSIFCLLPEATTDYLNFTTRCFVGIDFGNLVKSVIWQFITAYLGPITGPVQRLIFVFN